MDCVQNATQAGPSHRPSLLSLADRRQIQEPPVTVNTTPLPLFLYVYPVSAVVERVLRKMT